MQIQDLTHEHAVALGIPDAYIKAAAGSKIDLPTLIQLVLKYGLPILEILAKIFGWQLPPIPIPPTPPLPTP
jgi:hypothetical protein